jgi:hypothetical protein
LGVSKKTALGLPVVLVLLTSVLSPLVLAVVATCTVEASLGFVPDHDVERCPSGHARLVLLEDGPPAVAVVVLDAGGVVVVGAAGIPHLGDHQPGPGPPRW